MEHIYQQPQFGEEWFTYPKLYTEMVQKFPSGSKFVEVGSWKGKSAAYMAVEIINSGKDIEFYCVDTWGGSKEHQKEFDLENLYDIFLNNMGPVENNYIPMRTTSILGSEKFGDRSLDFVFIDASHEYEDVKNDIISWLPKVKNGGILAGHDYTSDQNSVFFGVYRAVNELLSNVHETEQCWIYNVV